MLQFQLKKEFDIVRLSKIIKILVKYPNITATIANQLITLDGAIEDDLLKQILSMSICVQNFSVSEAEASFFSNTDKTSESIDLNYDLIYSTVKRGEVYLCDLGKNMDSSEQAGIRPVIIIQNNIGNYYSGTTIVIPLTTKKKKYLPVHYAFTFSSQNMIDYNNSSYLKNNLLNIALAEQIRVINKKRLRSFLGTMTPEFMEEISKIIRISLDLTKGGASLTDKTLQQQRTLNITQIQLLSNVDIEELFKIQTQNTSNEIKCEKILQLFGFDLQRNGVQYLFKAILISLKGSYNLETLCESIAKNEPTIDKDEIKRLIIARVKEKFKLQKSTINFIRLVNCFLIKT